MRQPIEVKVDRVNALGYVRYIADREVAGTLVVWDDGWVAADVDDDGEVLGIEVVGLDSETLSRARAFAESRGLHFPALDAH